MKFNQRACTWTYMHVYVALLPQRVRAPDRGFTVVAAVFLSNRPKPASVPMTPFLWHNGILC